MTFETEMIKYLREQSLPANEGTYPPKLMAQITIKAFDELFERIEVLEAELYDSVSYEVLDKCEEELDLCKTELRKLKEKTKNEKNFC